jgi:hypothetical protein
MIIRTGVLISPDSNGKILQTRLLVFMVCQSDQRKLLRKQ